MTGTVGGVPIEVNVKYEDRLVAYLDVLGWRHFINGSTDNPEKLRLASDFLSALQFQRKGAEFLRDSSGHPNTSWETTILSDGIAISVKQTDLTLRELVEKIQSIYWVALHTGFLMRGGVSRGPLHHDGSIVVGPALNEAASFDKTKAPPGIRVAPRLVRDIVEMNKWAWRNQTPLHRPTLVRQLSATEFVLEVLASREFPGTTSDISRGFFVGDLSCARALVERNLAANIGEPNVPEKYDWFSKYVDIVAAEFDWIQAPNRAPRPTVVGFEPIDPWKHPDYRNSRPIVLDADPPYASLDRGRA